MSLDQDDNILVGAGTGGSTQGANVATDYNTTTESHYQLFKQAFGKDGDFFAVGDGADANSKPLPTQLYGANGSNILPLSANLLASNLHVLNVNLRGTSGSGNVPVDINAQSLGVVTVSPVTGGTPMGVCGDNFQIRTLYGGTGQYVGDTRDIDSVAVQGITNGLPVAVSATDLDIRGLTHGTDSINVHGTVNVAGGMTLSGGTVTVYGGATGFGTGTAPGLYDAPGSTMGFPSLLYGNSGGTAAAVGMSGDALKVSLQQTISANVESLSVSVDNPKSAGFNKTGSLITSIPALHDGDPVTGNTLGFPALMYGSCGGTAVGVAVSGGALVTTLQGSLNATISEISISVPTASGFSGGADRNTNGLHLLADGSVDGTTVGTPVLLYGSSGGETAVALGTTMTTKWVQGGLVDGDERLLGVAGVIKNTVAITGDTGPLDVKVTSQPNLVIGSVLPIVAVQAATGGITVNGMLQGISNAVKVYADGIGITIAGGSLTSTTVFGGSTGYGHAVAEPTIDQGPNGGTMGVPVFLYGNSGATAFAVGVSGNALKVSSMSPTTVLFPDISTTPIAERNPIAVVGGVTGFGPVFSDPEGAGLSAGPGFTTGIPVLLYGNSGGVAGTPIGVGMSGDGIKVSVIDGVDINVASADVQIPEGLSIVNKDNTFLVVGLTGDSMYQVGGAGTSSDLFVGLTGGYSGPFGLTQGGDFASGVNVYGVTGAHPVTVSDTTLLETLVGGNGFTYDILEAMYATPEDDTEFDPSKPGRSIHDELADIKSSLDGTLSVNTFAAAVSTDISNPFGSNSLTTQTPGTDVNGIDLANSVLNVDVNAIKIPDSSHNADGAAAVGNTAGLLPSGLHTTENEGFQLTSHTLTKGVNIKNTSGTGTLHVGFSEAVVEAEGGYEIGSREEVFIETNNLNNLWVAACPGASGCYIGG